MSNPFVPPKGEGSPKLIPSGKVLDVFITEGGKRVYVERTLDQDVPAHVRAKIREGKLRGHRTYIGDGVIVYAQAESSGGPIPIEKR